MDEDKFRLHIASFAEDLKEKDVRKLKYIQDIPREELNSALDIFQYLEEKLVLDFQNPQTLVTLMRKLKKEKWAVDTERIIAESKGLIATETQCPIQETVSTTTTKSTTHELELKMEASEQTVVRRVQPSSEQKKSNSLKRRLGIYIQENESEKNNESSSDEEDRDEDSSCFCCGLKSKATLLEALNTPEIIQGIESIVENKLNRRFSSQSTIDISLSDESLNRHEIASTDDISYRGTPVSIKPSSVSKTSSRSSGYGSMIYGPPPDILVESSIDGSTLSPRSTIDSRLSSTDSYKTTLSSEDDDFYDQQREYQITERESTSCDDSVITIHKQSHFTNIVYSPPPSGKEILVGEMEISVKELLKDVQRKVLRRVYMSNAFPSLGHGLQFQLHLYPNSYRSSCCSVYLVVLGWTQPERYPLPKMMIKVSAYSYDSKGIDILYSKSEEHELDVTTDLPPTPHDVDFKNLAIFPSLIAHKDLTTIQSPNINVKVTLSPRSTIDSRLSSTDSYKTALSSEDDDFYDQQHEYQITERESTSCDDSVFTIHKQSHFTNIVYSPPPSGKEILVGEMEISVKELLKDVQRKVLGRVYMSNAFPSLGHGLQFQLHLYPNSYGSSCCSVYLVVLGWTQPERYPLPKMMIKVSAYSYDSKGIDILYSKSEEHELDVTTDLPPTPHDVNFKTLAVFPSLITHKDLTIIQSPNINVKVTLSPRTTIDSWLSSTASYKMALSSEDEDFHNQHHECQINERESTSCYLPLVWQNSSSPRSTIDSQQSSTEMVLSSEDEGLCGNMLEMSFDENGLFYHSYKYGVTIIIPPGAVLKPCTLQIGARLLLPRFRSSDSFIPVSPFVHIHIDSVLAKPAELYIPHYVDVSSDEDKMKLCLLTTEANCLHEDQSFMFTVNSTASVTFSPSLAKIHTYHFCWLCIATEDRTPPPKRYHLLIAEKELKDGSLNVDISIMHSIQLCIEKVRLEQFEGYEVILHGPVFFNDDSKSVIKVTFDPTDIPGWVISFRDIYFDCICEDDIDFYKILDCTPDTVSDEDIETLKMYEKQKSYPPRFKLLISPNGSESGNGQVTFVLHGLKKKFFRTIKMGRKKQGTHPNYNIQNIDYNAATLSHHDSPTCSNGSDIFVIDLMNLLGENLHSNWMEFGYHLEIPMEELHKIEVNVGHDRERCTRQVLLMWRKLNPTASWEPIAEALKQSRSSLLSAFVSKRYTHSGPIFCQTCQCTHDPDFNDVHINDVLASFPNSSALLHSRPDISKLNNLISAEIPSKWELFGVQLGLEHSYLDCLHDQFHDPRNRFTHLFDEWRKRKPSEFNWSTVIRILCSRIINEFTVAENVLRKLSTVDRSQRECTNERRQSREEDERDTLQKPVDSKPVPQRQRKRKMEVLESNTPPINTPVKIKFENPPSKTSELYCLIFMCIILFCLFVIYDYVIC